MDRQPITKEGYEKLREEITMLETERMPEIVKAIAAARAEGDLSENAEYHGQREAQGQLQARINTLKAKLNSCYVVDPKDLDHDIVNFGAVVTVFDLDDEFEEQYEFVGPGEEDFTADPIRILTTSPLAQALLGKKIGERIETEVPSGTLHMEIRKIEFAE